MKKQQRTNREQGQILVRHSQQSFEASSRGHRGRNTAEGEQSSLAVNGGLKEGGEAAMVCRATTETSEALNAAEIFVAADWLKQQ